jgi:flagellin-specific chaperone FliS
MSLALSRRPKKCYAELKELKLIWNLNGVEIVRTLTERLNYEAAGDIYTTLDPLRQYSTISARAVDYVLENSAYSTISARAQ